jgi:hypothetical protein
MKSPQPRIGEVAEGAGDVRFDPRHYLLLVADSSGTLTIFHKKQATSFTKILFSPPR